VNNFSIPISILKMWDETPFTQIPFKVKFVMCASSIRRCVAFCSCTAFIFLTEEMTVQFAFNTWQQQKLALMLAIYLSGTYVASILLPH